MTKEGSTRIINFLTPGAVVLLLGVPYKLYSENDLFLLNSSSLLLGIDQKNMKKEYSSKDDSGRVYQNCKFHDTKIKEGG